jgi:hypothetical protein
MDESQNVGSDMPAQGGMSQAVETTTEAPSTSAEETSQNVSEASGKTEITQNGQEGEPRIPMSRFQSVNERMKAAEEKAAKFDKMMSNPDYARGYVENMPGVKEQPPEVKEALRILKENGVATVQDIDARFEQWQKSQQDQQTQQKTADSFLKQSRELSSKYDGSNGLPAFDPKVVANYMDNYGFVFNDAGEPDVEKAFMIMNMEAFVDGQARMQRSTPNSASASRPSTDGRASDNAALKEAQSTGDFSNVFKNIAKLPDRWK